MDVIYNTFVAGKTHTLMANDGITQDVINKVFDHIHGDRKHEFKVIQIKDLLTIKTLSSLSYSYFNISIFTE